MDREGADLGRGVGKFGTRSGDSGAAGADYDVGERTSVYGVLSGANISMEPEDASDVSKEVCSRIVVAGGEFDSTK